MTQHSLDDTTRLFSLIIALICLRHLWFGLFQTDSDTYIDMWPSIFPPLSFLISPAHWVLIFFHNSPVHTSLLWGRNVLNIIGDLIVLNIAFRPRLIRTESVLFPQAFGFAREYRLTIFYYLYSILKRPKLFGSGFTDYRTSKEMAKSKRLLWCNQREIPLVFRWFYMCVCVCVCKSDLQ